MLKDSGPAVQPSGNRCGHDPAAPRWFAPPERHKPCPGIYYAPAKTLPSLNFANDKDGQQRSCLGVLGCLVHYLDPRQQARLLLEQAESPHQGPVQTPRPR